MSTNDIPERKSSGTTTRQRLPDHIEETRCVDRYGRFDGYAYTCERCGLTVPAREKHVLVGCCTR